jgi:predicted O-methyltransferase YrrM
VLGTIGAFGGAITVTFALGQPLLAVVLVGMLGVMTVLAVLQLSAGKEIRAIAREAADAVTRAETAARQLELAQRRIVSAIESERLAAAERHQALITSLDEVHSTAEVSRDSLLAAVESERRAAADRHSALLTSLHESQKAIIADQQRLQRQTASVQRDQTRQVEALLQLFRGFVPRAPMPSSGGGWALNPTGLLELLFHIDRIRPKVVLELGSGASSIWIAYALEKFGGRLVTLDHEVKYADQTRFLISMHELDKVAQVRLAPLRSMSIGGEEFDWYDPAVVEDVNGIDLLLVDGPPGKTGPGARYPALPMLEPKLAANATVILDDVDRSDEQRILERWLTDVPGLRREQAIFNRQAVLSYSRPT